MIGCNPQPLKPEAETVLPVIVLAARCLRHRRYTLASCPDCRAELADQRRPGCARAA